MTTKMKQSKNWQDNSKDLDKNDDDEMSPTVKLFPSINKQLNWVQWNFSIIP